MKIVVFFSVAIGTPFGAFMGGFSTPPNPGQNPAPPPPQPFSGVQPEPPKEKGDVDQAPPDPSTDPTVRSDVLTASREGVNRVNRISKGLDSNEARRYRREGRVTLRVTISKKYGLTIDQVKRIVGE